MYTLKKIIGITGVVLSVVLIVMGFLTPIPNKKISTSSYSSNGYTEYVGGDAYNIQIEAALRGGEIAGGQAARAIFISFGVVLLFLSLAYDSMNTKPEKVAYNAKGTTPVYKSETTQLAEKLAEANTNEQVKRTWKCKCGFENPEHADSCHSCGEYK